MHNKYITLILAIVGMLLNLAFHNFAFTVQILITGAASGLVATGSFEMIRNLIEKEKEKNKNN